MTETQTLKSSNHVTPDSEENLDDLRPISHRYDFVIAGGGLSGLSLAYQLAQSPFGDDKSILIVDQSPKSRNDRTWGFWSDRPTPFDGIVDRSWKRLRFATPNLERTSNLGGYRYNVIRGLDFYEFIRDDLAALNNVVFQQGRVRHIEDGSDAATVTIDDQVVSAKWLFDSCFGRAKSPADLRRYHDLKLHFVGWEIRTEEPAFDPWVATLMDFRTPQENETRFFYILPFNERQALVEYTIFSNSVLSHAEYQRSLRQYIREQLAIEVFEIVRQESGCIPVTDRPFQRQLGQRVMSIGAKAGRIKPTTGYAFTRIQEDSAAIISSLQRNGHPFDVPADPYRYRLSDSILLEIMAQRGRLIRPIFEAMFRRNKIGRIFRFLDEVASPWEQLAIIPTLPALPFLRVLFRRLILRGAGSGDGPDLRAFLENEI
jgi:lycopene beta-cyclase